MKEIFTTKEAIQVLGVSESFFNECTRTSIKGKRRTPIVKLQGEGRGKQRAITIVDLCVLEVIKNLNKNISVLKLRHLSEFLYEIIEHNGLDDVDTVGMVLCDFSEIQIKFGMTRKFLLDRVLNTRWKK